MAKPICIRCGSENVFKPGFCSFHWRNGQWVMERGSQEMADSECFHCMKCGLTMVGDTTPPFNLSESLTTEQLFAAMNKRQAGAE